MSCRTIASAAVLAAATAPAFASGVVHPDTSEMGYTVHPAHAQPGKSRAEVLAELDSARSQPSWAALRVGTTPTTFTSRLTRQQGEAELLSAQKHPSWSARRVGAPVSMD